MSNHLWVRAEQRALEQRVPITPSGVATLIQAGWTVTVERSAARAIPDQAYEKTGCMMVDTDSWHGQAPDDAIILGLKELDPDGPDLRHRHIMFGHAFKGQADGPALLARFARGEGTLLDLEYLTNENGRRVAAFGYWAGFAGAAVGLMAWSAQQRGQILGPVPVFEGRDAVVGTLSEQLGTAKPSVIVIGALGRVGRGACELAEALGLPTTRWDMAETAHGGPFPEILAHDLFVNCILASPGVPVFVEKSAVQQSRQLSVIADVSCDPSSAYNPIPIYDSATSFDRPTVAAGTADNPLDVMAIDNLPSMLPVESSEDYAGQLLPHLLTLANDSDGVWSRAESIFEQHVKQFK